MEDKLELKTLIELREKALQTELTDSLMSKVKGWDHLGSGRKCYIQWKDWEGEYVDTGYIFTLPIGNDSELGDVFVHIPKPNNPEGMGTPPEVFTHLYTLLTNDLVDYITVIN